MSKSLIFNCIGQGQPLVFLHGWGVNSAVWQPLVEKLKTNYQVITIDLPGFGLNVDNSITPYSLEQVSELIYQTIAQPAIYVGWSLGGLIATQIALTHSARVQGLVTIASSPRFLEQSENNQVMWPGIKAEVLKLFHQQLGQDIKKTLARFLEIQAMGSPHARKHFKQIQQLVMQYPMPSQQAFDQSLALLESEDLRTELTKIKLPFLRLYGRLDSLVPASVIENINQLSPNSEHYIFNKASHAPFISHLNDFYQQLNQWLMKFTPAQ